MGVFALFVHHAGALAQHFGGAHAAAAFAQNIGGENHAGRAAQIAGGDFLDERGHVDVRGAGDGARRVETIQAARRFDGRLPRSHAPARCRRSSARIVRERASALFREVAYERVPPEAA